jgi:magnesium transporter
MALVRDLADRLLRDHPGRAAAVLERHEAAAAVPPLERGEAADAAEVLRRLSPLRASRVLALLSRGRAAALLGALDLDEAVRLARRLEGDVRAELFTHLDERRARAIGALLAFPEDTAGALMDPDVLALPEGLTARDALARVRSEPVHARYNLYVVDEAQRLVGALNLRELLLAPPEQGLRALMVEGPQRLVASADRATVVSHPGWREVHSLPVVDERGAYLGAIRYRTLRELERALLTGREEEQSTAGALGQLFATGASGLFEALGGGAAGAEARRGR